MALFYVINQSLVESSKFEEDAIAQGALAIQNTSSLSPSAAAVAAPTDVIPQFQPIGIGKPLSVEIVSMYLGDTISSFLSRKKDVLLVSGVKAAQTFSATSRAINFAKKSAEDEQYLEFSAITDGTPIVYYTKAMDTETTLISFEFIADSFDQNIFDDISKLFTAAAGLPIFLPYAGYLMGGSNIIKNAGQLGNTLFAKKPFLADTVTLRFGSPLFPVSEAQLLLICNDADASELNGLTINIDTSTPGNVKARLINTDSSIYSGKAPYLIISLDGRERKELENFAPTLAASALLQQFYGTDDVAGAITTSLQDAMSLYNDFNYNKKATDLKAQLKTLDSNSDEYKKGKELFDAYNKNIQNPVFSVAFP